MHNKVIFFKEKKSIVKLVFCNKHFIKQVYPIPIELIYIIKVQIRIKERQEIQVDEIFPKKKTKKKLRDKQEFEIENIEN